MDELTTGDPDRAPALRFGPDRRLTAVVGALAVLAAVLAATTGDPGGRILWTVAAVVLAGYAVGDLMFWPRLEVDGSGLRIRTPFARHELRWPEVEQVRADVRSRHGLRSATLEVDAGQTLVVFSRRALGADPQQVAELIAARAGDRDAQN